MDVSVPIWGIVGTANIVAVPPDVIPVRWLVLPVVVRSPSLSMVVPASPTLMPVSVVVSVAAQIYVCVVWNKTRRDIAGIEDAVLGDPDQDAFVDQGSGRELQVAI